MQYSKSIRTKNKWKIINKNKFKIIHIFRTKTDDIYLNNILQYTNQWKILGLTFNSTGILPQIKIRKAIALSNLAKLHKFYALNSQNKLKLCDSLIRSALIYPPVIKNTISKSAML